MRVRLISPAGADVSGVRTAVVSAARDPAAVTLRHDGSGSVLTVREEELLPTVPPVGGTNPNPNANRDPNPHPNPNPNPDPNPDPNPNPNPNQAKMTAMAFDEAGRRLITGGNDGTVRVWNFSNGQLLKELRNEGSSEVSSIQFIVEGQNKLIVAGGWNRKVVVRVRVG